MLGDMVGKSGAPMVGRIVNKREGLRGARWLGVTCGGRRRRVALAAIGRAGVLAGRLAGVLELPTAVTADLRLGFRYPEALRSEEVRRVLRRVFRDGLDVVLTLRRTMFLAVTGVLYCGSDGSVKAWRRAGEDGQVTTSPVTGWTLIPLASRYRTPFVS